MNDEISSEVNSEAVSLDSQTCQVNSGFSYNFENEDDCWRYRVGSLENWDKSWRLPQHCAPKAPGQHFSTVQIMFSLGTWSRIWNHRWFYRTNLISGGCGPPPCSFIYLREAGPLLSSSYNWLLYHVVILYQPGTGPAREQRAGLLRSYSYNWLLHYVRSSCISLAPGYFQFIDS